MIWQHISSLVGGTATKSMPVFEMANETVQMARLPNMPDWKKITSPRNDLIFTGVQLAHAVIKADFLEYRNPTFPGIGFLLQSHHIIDWVGTTMCLKSGAASLLSDFALTSLIGRLGQGLALLFAQDQGYVFTAHLRNLLESSGHQLRNTNGKAVPIADFVCDGRVGRAIVESKASFSSARNHSTTVKSLLKKSLNGQVAPWMKKLLPPAKKSFVVASYLRERDPALFDPSSVVFVDPEDGPDGSEIEISPETVARENYAAWLTAMGLTPHAERLRSSQPDRRVEVQFAGVSIQDREIAFPATPGWIFRGGVPKGPWVVGGPPLVGIERSALLAISNATGGQDEELLSYLARQDGRFDRENNPDHSVFLDGTFFGAIRYPSSVQFESVML